MVVKPDISTSMDVDASANILASIQKVIYFSCLYFISKIRLWKAPFNIQWITMQSPQYLSGQPFNASSPPFCNDTPSSPNPKEHTRERKELASTKKIILTIALYDSNQQLSEWKLNVRSHCRNDPKEGVFLTLQRDRCPRVDLEGPEEIHELSAVLCALLNNEQRMVLTDCVKIKDHQVKFKKMSFKELKSKMGPMKSNEINFFLDIGINGTTYVTQSFRIESRIPLKRKAEEIKEKNKSQK